MKNNKTRWRMKYIMEFGKSYFFSLYINSLELEWEKDEKCMSYVIVKRIKDI